MAEDLKENYNSDYLGLVIVTPEMVATKIRAIRDNRTDGIPPKLILKLVKQTRRRAPK